VSFTADSTGVADVRWMGDNDNWLYVNGTYIGSNTSQYSAWNNPAALLLTAGTTYTVDLDVYNEPQGFGNPTGARVEFSGPVCVTVDPVPDETPSLYALMIASGPVAIILLRKRARRRSATLAG
jgi:hypothetical protein